MLFTLTQGGTVAVLLQDDVAEHGMSRFIILT